MRTKILISFLLISGFAWAQEEYDDMYFNSKDRLKVQESPVRHRQAPVRTFEGEDETSAAATINPTDSYSGRGENPEYRARVRTSPSGADRAESGYFLSNYQPLGVNQSLAALPNNNFNRWNPWMMNPGMMGGMMGMGMGLNAGWGGPWGMGMGWNDPWMMGFNPGWNVGMGWNSPWGMGWNNPWGMGMGGLGMGWNSPWGMGMGGMGMGMGMGWNSPWGMGMGWNNPWGMGMGMGWNNPWGMGMGMGMGWNNWGWNRPMVFVNPGNDGQRVTYQRRQDRSSALDNAYDNARQSQPSYTRSGREVSSGRSRSEANSDYYDRTWRARSESNAPTRSGWDNYNSNSRSSWGNSNYNYNSGGRSGYESSPSRSSWNSGSGFGGGSRSGFGGGASGGGFSGGSRGRGRD